jgi:hypothetical protein
VALERTAVIRPPWRGFLVRRPSSVTCYDELWRLSPSALDRDGNTELATRAAMAAGVRLEVVTDARQLVVGLCAADETSPMDVLVDGQLFARHTLQPGENSIVVDLPGDECELSVWLPQFGPVSVRDPELRGASYASPPSTQGRWITYGSSITHAREAAGPSATWPAQIARSQRWDLLNLGFAAQCHLDPLVARTIAAEGADIISLCLGINIYGQASYSARTLRPALSGFLDIIRESHPSTPLVVISPIASPSREMEPNATGLTLAAVRRIVQESVESLIAAGDTALVLLDGQSLLGGDDGHLLVDGLHPGPAGGDQIARRLAPILVAATGHGVPAASSPPT